MALNKQKVTKYKWHVWDDTDPNKFMMLDFEPLVNLAPKGSALVHWNAVYHVFGIYDTTTLEYRMCYDYEKKVDSISVIEVPQQYPGHRPTAALCLKGYGNI